MASSRVRQGSDVLESQMNNKWFWLLLAVYCDDWSLTQSLFLSVRGSLSLSECCVF